MNCNQSIILLPALKSNRLFSAAPHKGVAAADGKIQTHMAKDYQCKCEVLYGICNDLNLNFVSLTLVVEVFCLFCVCRATQEAIEEKGKQEQEGRI